MLFESALLVELDFPHSSIVEFEELVDFPGVFEDEDEDDGEEEDVDHNEGEERRMAELSGFITPGRFSAGCSA